MPYSCSESLSHISLFSGRCSRNQSNLNQRKILVDVILLSIYPDINVVVQFIFGKNGSVFHRGNSSILGITPQIWRSPPGQISTIFLSEDSVYLLTVFQEVLSSTDNIERGSLFCQKRGLSPRFFSCIGNKQFSYPIPSILRKPARMPRRLGRG
jgi:hypothetical protein